MFIPYWLEKLTIKAYKTKNRKDIDDDLLGTFKAMFNPESYNIKLTNCYQEQQGVNIAGQGPNYSRTISNNLSIKLLLDSTGVGNIGLVSTVKNIINLNHGVNPMIKRFLNLTYYSNDGTHQPSYLTIKWGDFVFNCRLVSVDIKYTLFNKSGNPLRAELDTEFKGTILEPAHFKLNSPDLTHVRVVHGNDTLPLMTQSIYKDSSYYIKVASANKLNSLRRPKVGKTLRFPPIKE